MYNNTRRRRQKRQDRKCYVQSCIWITQTKPGFPKLKKCVENDYVINKAEYPGTVTVVQSLLLNYQHNYNSNINSQSKGVSNQLIFAQRGKTGDDEGNRKEKEKRSRRYMDHITCSDCG